MSEKSIIKVDNFPALSFSILGEMEQMGITFSAKMKVWYIMYEDKIVLLQCLALNNAELKQLDKLFFLITNSVIFPDQYD